MPRWRVQQESGTYFMCANNSRRNLSTPPTAGWSGEGLFDSLLVGEVPFDTLPLGEMPVDSVPLGEAPFDSSSPSGTGPF